MPMKENYFRFFKPTYIIGFILILGSIITPILELLINILNEGSSFKYYQYPSASLFIWFVIYLIDWKLWNKPLFKLLYAIPDMSGRYEGSIKYVNPKTTFEEEKNCVIEVFQSGSKLKVQSFFSREDDFEKSPSNSLIESVIKNDNETYSLVFTYHNKGICGVFHPHEGTNILEYINNSDGRFLKGHYYTNRIPQTKGEVEVKFITNKLKNDF